MANPRKPRALKLLEKTLRKHRDKPEPEFRPISVAEPPEWLTGPDAVACWRELSAILIETRVLTQGDLRMLAHLCNWEADALALYRSNRQPTAAEKNALRLTYGSFGLDPSCRAKATPVGAKPKDNAFAEFG